MSCIPNTFLNKNIFIKKHAVFHFDEWIWSTWFWGGWIGCEIQSSLCSLREVTWLVSVSLLLPSNAAASRPKFLCSEQNGNSTTATASSPGLWVIESRCRESALFPAPSLSLRVCLPVTSSPQENYNPQTSAATGTDLLQFCFPHNNKPGKFTEKHPSWVTTATRRMSSPTLGSSNLSPTLVSVRNASRPFCFFFVWLFFFQ